MVQRVLEHVTYEGDRVSDSIPSSLVEDKSEGFDLVHWLLHLSLGWAKLPEFAKRRWR